MFVYLQHYPLAQLIRSSQTCQYKFDNDNKHMTSGSCTERHILVPYSHKYVPTFHYSITLNVCPAHTFEGSILYWLNYLLFVVGENMELPASENKS